jgi:ArsR family transcriptional regulator, arsenate/arsenite/antimonite-responsive transcriptional repressor
MADVRTGELPLITPRERQPGGCTKALVEPDLSVADARDLAAIARALGDPTRLRIVDTLRKAAPVAVCQCELMPLFEISQPALAKHLKVLISAGVVDRERRGLWTYYYLRDVAVEGLSEWLSPSAAGTARVGP